MTKHLQCFQAGSLRSQVDEGRGKRWQRATSAGICEPPTAIRSTEKLDNVRITICLNLPKRHVLLRVRQRLKPKVRVESMSISRSQEKSAQSLQIRMLKNGAHEQLRY